MDTVICNVDDNDGRCTADDGVGSGRGFLLTEYERSRS